MDSANMRRPVRVKICGPAIPSAGPATNDDVEVDVVIQSKEINGTVYAKVGDKWLYGQELNELGRSFTYMAEWQIWQIRKLHVPLRNEIALAQCHFLPDGVMRQFGMWLMARSYIFLSDKVLPRPFVALLHLPVNIQLALDMGPRLTRPQIVLRTVHMDRLTPYHRAELMRQPEMMNGQLSKFIYMAVTLFEQLQKI